MANIIPQSFNVNIELPVQMKAKTSMYLDNEGKQLTVLFNFDNSMSCFGSMTSWDGGVTSVWSHMHTFPIREAKEGLQFYDTNGMYCWRFFEESVQEIYAQHLLEKEIK